MKVLHRQKIRHYKIYFFNKLNIITVLCATCIGIDPNFRTPLNVKESSQPYISAARDIIFRIRRLQVLA